MDLKFLGQVQTFDHRRRELKGCHTVGRRMTTVYELLSGDDRLQQLCPIFYWTALRVVPVEKIEAFARIWSQLPGFVYALVRQLLGGALDPVLSLDAWIPE